MNKEELSNMELVEQKVQQQNENANALSGEKRSPENFMDDYSQEKDADFTDVELHGKHFLVKAPDRKNNSGLILSEKAQKELQAIRDTPGFQEDIFATKVSKECTKVSEGDMVLLSPHVQTLDIELPAKDQNDEDEIETVLYLMIHEDYVLMTKSKEE